MQMVLKSQLQGNTLRARLFMVWHLSKHKVPFAVVTAFMVFSVGLAVTSLYKVGMFFFGAFFGTDKFLSGSASTIGFFPTLFYVSLALMGWLLSTRTQFYTKKRIRTLAFFIMVTSVFSTLLWYGESRFYLYIIPVLEIIVANGQNAVLDEKLNIFIVQLALSQRNDLYTLVMLFPLLFVGFVTYFFVVKYHAYEVELNKAFEKFKWRGKWLQRFEWLEETSYYPHVYLGYDAHTKEMIRLFGYDRTLNTIIVGAIGTGKSAALALPTLQADFDHMIKFIDEYPEISKLENYHSEEISGQYLNGISVIDPSNDLCKSVYKLAKAHGIADEAITYIDPTNENTPSFNPMRGPTDKVAEVFAEVISGLSNENGMDFFAQAQRNHLKQYIYLLKEHDPNKDVTFDMLIDMYDRPAYAKQLHEKLKARMPKRIVREAFKSRDEYNYWEIIKGIDAWFDNTLVIERDRQGNPVLDEQQRANIVDAEAEYVKGLRNTLKDLASNILIRRVLFGTSDFDFDRHLAIGGVLLVNTAKGELSALSRVLGKIVLLNLQNASFRRQPKISPYHHIVVDESPEYLYPQFKSFPTQSRKYKVILTILMQTLSQLEDEFGETYKDTLLAALRQKMFYGDSTGKDAQAFSDIAGERMTFKEGESEMETAAIQNDPSSRQNASYQRQLEANLSASDAIYLEAFSCAVKLVEQNTPMPVRIVKANFVPKRLLEKADVLTTDEAMQYWLAERRKFGIRFNTGLEEMKTIEETEKEHVELLSELKLLSDEERAALEKEQMQQPLEKVKYVDATTSVHPAPTYTAAPTEHAPLSKVPKTAAHSATATVAPQQTSTVAPIAEPIHVAPVIETVQVRAAVAPTLVQSTVADDLPVMDFTAFAPRQQEVAEDVAQESAAVQEDEQAQPNGEQADEPQAVTASPMDFIQSLIQPIDEQPIVYKESVPTKEEEERIKEIF